MPPSGYSFGWMMLNGSCGTRPANNATFLSQRLVPFQKLFRQEFALAGSSTRRSITGRTGSWSALRVTPRHSRVTIQPTFCCPEFKHVARAIETRLTQKKWRKADALNATNITTGARRDRQSTASAFPNCVVQLNCTPPTCKPANGNLPY